MPNSAPVYLAVFNNKLFFGAQGNDGNGVELWEYDGINSPTRVADIYSGPNSSLPYSMAVFNNKLYFTANPTFNSGYQLWMYDGVNPPSLVAYLGGDYYNGSYKSYLTVYNNKLYFSADAQDGDGIVIWMYDGVNFPSKAWIGGGNPDPASLTVFNGKLYFQAANENPGLPSRLLWVYDGINPPSHAADIQFGRNDGSLDSLNSMTVYNNQLYFQADGSDGAGFELWSYDGVNPASRVADIYSGNSSSYPSHLVEFNNILYFRADGGDGAGYELWSYYDDSVPWLGTITPSFTPLTTLTNNPTITPSMTPTITFTPLPTEASSPTITPSITQTLLPTETGTPIFTPSPVGTRTPTATPTLGLIINEVGWMGTLASSSDEWIELYNPSPVDIPLTGWKLVSTNGVISILLEANDANNTIHSGEYYVLAPVSAFTDVVIRQNLTASLNDNGMSLQLLSPAGILVDTANSDGGTWPAGNASTKATMERHVGITLDTAANWFTFAGTSIKHDRNNNLVKGTPGYTNWAASVTATPTKTSTATFTSTPITVTFSDVPSTYWAWSFIERLYHDGITGGCLTSPLMYCPETNVTRAQMAVFLLRGEHGSAYAPPSVGSDTGFIDVPADYWAAAWIKQLALEGVTSGCGPGLYCPEISVTRDQMAVFLLRAEHGASYTPPPATGVFSDVPTDHWAAAWIERLAAEDITGGCGAGTYCPTTPVTRAQMAVFLVKTFNLP